MLDEHRIPRVAALLADGARAKIVWALIDGSRRPAGELAFCAQVSAQSASAHLAKLVAGGLIEVESQGRHRYFRIAGPEVAAAVEALASLSVSPAPRAARPVSASQPFLKARTCYGHLAGKVAVQVLQSMLARGWLEESHGDYAPTRRGERELGKLGIEVAALQGGRRAFARCCVDLTERRPHLGGALGDALLETYVERGWILRRRGSRVVSITPRGAESFARIWSAVP